VRFAIGESVVAVLLPSFEVVEDGSVVASEELCDAGCAPVLCGESDGEGASSDFWVCVWVVEQLLELRVFVWCQLNEYRCSHVEIIPQRHLPTAWAKFMKTSATENPLLKVPPAGRGNRTRARFPSRSGGNLQEGGQL
jgi:hypothetical protein